MLEEREIRQYFHDIYVTFLGSNLKNNSNVNPKDLVDHAEAHVRVEVERLEKLTEWYSSLKHQKKLNNNFAGGRWSHLTSLINWKNHCNVIPATICSLVEVL